MVRTQMRWRIAVVALGLLATRLVLLAVGMALTLLPGPYVAYHEQRFDRYFAECCGRRPSMKKRQNSQGTSPVRGHLSFEIGMSLLP